MEGGHCVAERAIQAVRRCRIISVKLVSLIVTDRFVSPRPVAGSRLRQRLRVCGEPGPDGQAPA
jgi:hypothetical protein